jgi:4-alpha-glucanotransferase
MLAGNDHTVENRERVRAALALLGVERLVLAIHDAAFPGGDADDLGEGSPASPGGRRFLAFAAGLGFDAIQLGPAGEVTAFNRSPYDATLFSRSLLRLTPRALLADAELAGVVDPAVVDAAVASAPAVGARAALARLVDAVAVGWGQGPSARMRAISLASFRAGARAWLERDALYEALTAEHGHDDWTRWPEADRRPPGPERAAELRARHAAVVTRWELGQFLLDRQHAALRAEARALGLRLFADMHIGLSPRDAWALAPLFLPGYAMGAPPSRTNPEGQPWGYAVLDPAQRGTPAAPGPGMAFVAARVDRMLEGYDGVRIDHPHGWVCPWVYRTDLPDPGSAVRAGARLFETPDDPAHPRLAALAIARPEQIDRDVAPYADGRVRELDEAQVERYAVVVDHIVARVRARGGSLADVACEVLSTCPTPLAAVLARHGLGRFRVTQKARLDDPTDVYRAENARPEDWVMIGNHDTPPVWALADGPWVESGRRAAWAAHLGERLRLAPDALAADTGALAHALLAELLASPARQVLVHVGDLLGEREPYNRPGVVDPRNWTWRVPADYEAVHAERLARGAALSIARAAAVALRARGLDPALAARLEAQSVTPSSARPPSPPTAP